MAFNAEKKKKLVELLAKCRAAAAAAGTLTPANLPPSATSAPKTFEPTPVDNRQKGVVVVTAGSEDEDTCMGLVFKRPRVGDVVAPSHFVFDGHALSFRDNPPSASSPQDLIAHEGGGRVLPKVTKHLLLLSFQPSSNKLFNASKTKRWLKASRSISSPPTSLYPRCKTCKPGWRS